MSPDMQTQVLLLVGQVIRSVLKKNADATERRKKAVKRKRELNGVEEEGEPKPRIPRKFGIAAPVDISKDLADFMGLGAGEKVARTTVVKFVNEYIGKNNLQNPEKKSEIKFDETLQGLFNPGPSFGPVTYFNLWKLLGPHFLTKKKSSSLPPASAGSPLPARQPLRPTQGVA
jgi:chromatin remodeling complex protein RSC6